MFIRLHRKHKYCIFGLLGHAGKGGIWDDKKVGSGPEENRNVVEEKVLIYENHACA